MALARTPQFYKGRRQKRSMAFIPVALLLGIVALVIVLFYGLQKYAVIEKDSVSVVLPMMEEKTTIDANGNEVKVFDEVNTEIAFLSPDYSSVTPTVDGKVSELRAIYVSADEITPEKIDEYLARLISGNALMLEMKTSKGSLMWDSQTQLAKDYGLYVASQQSSQFSEVMDKLNESGVYLVAKISCCIDELLATRTGSFFLSNNGFPYRDDSGTWLDPYSNEIRTYIVQLCNELYDMGFDEVVLADLRHPTLPEGVQIGYTADMSTTPSPVTAVCGFAISVANQLKEREGKLSVYCYSPQALVRADTATGQDATLFMKIFDRVYYETDKYTYSYNLQDITPSVLSGKAENRLIPVVINYLPSNSSWVYIEVPEEEDG